MKYEQDVIKLWNVDWRVSYARNPALRGSWSHGIQMEPDQDESIEDLTVWLYTENGQPIDVTEHLSETTLTRIEYEILGE